MYMNLETINRNTHTFETPLYTLKIVDTNYNCRFEGQGNYEVSCIRFKENSSHYYGYLKAFILNIQQQQEIKIQQQQDNLNSEEDLIVMTLKSYIFDDQFRVIEFPQTPELSQIILEQASHILLAKFFRETGLDWPEQYYGSEYRRNKNFYLDRKYKQIVSIWDEKADLETQYARGNLRLEVGRRLFVEIPRSEIEKLNHIDDKENTNQGLPWQFFNWNLKPVESTPRPEPQENCRVM